MSTYRLKGASGAVINQSFTLGERTLIGRVDDCDLRVDQDGVQGRHAEIIQESDGGLTLTHLAGDGETRLNGEPVQTASLASGKAARLWA